MLLEFGPIISDDGDLGFGVVVVKLSWRFSCLQAWVYVHSVYLLTRRQQQPNLPLHCRERWRKRQREISLHLWFSEKSSLFTLHNNRYQTLIFLYYWPKSSWPKVCSTVSITAKKQALNSSSNLYFSFLILWWPFHLNHNLAACVWHYCLYL